MRKLDIRLKVFCFVVPAQAGTQGFQSLALGPRFRGGDDLRGLRVWITASFAGTTTKWLPRSRRLGARMSALSRRALSPLYPCGVGAHDPSGFAGQSATTRERLCK